MAVPVTADRPHSEDVCPRVEVVEGLLLDRIDLHCGELAVDGEVEPAPHVLSHEAEAVGALGDGAAPVAGEADYPAVFCWVLVDRFLVHCVSPLWTHLRSFIIVLHGSLSS